MHVVTTSTDGTARIWRLADGSLLRADGALCGGMILAQALDRAQTRVVHTQIHKLDGHFVYTQNLKVT